MLLPRLPPGSFFSHTTAAQLWGLPLPLHARTDLRPHVSVPAGHRAVDTRDAIGHEVVIRAGEVTSLGRIHVSTPARIWMELSPLLGLSGLVALGDALLRSGSASEAELDHALSRRGFRGRRNAIAARPLLDERAESPMESILRVALVTAGLPALLVNEAVYDPAGRFVARPDLRFRDYPVVVEYDGDGHRSDAVQWRRDVRRYAELEDLGFDAIRATAADLPHFTRIVARARHRIQAASSRGHRPDPGGVS